MGAGEVHTGFCWGYLRVRVHLEDAGIDGRKILEYIIEKWDGDTEWIDPAQDRDRWPAFMKAVLNFRVP
jgi:hypothetical protein